MVSAGETFGTKRVTINLLKHHERPIDSPEKVDTVNHRDLRVTDGPKMHHSMVSRLVEDEGRL